MKTSRCRSCSPSTRFVEVPEPLKEAVSIPMEALMSEAPWKMEKEQQICVNIEMYDEVQRQLMRRGRLQAVVDTIGRDGTDSTERDDDVATNEANE